MQLLRTASDRSHCGPAQAPLGAPCCPPGSRVPRQRALVAEHSVGEQDLRHCVQPLQPGGAGFRLGGACRAAPAFACYCRDYWCQGAVCGALACGAGAKGE